METITATKKNSIQFVSSVFLFLLRILNVFCSHRDCSYFFVSPLFFGSRILGAWCVLLYIMSTHASPKHWAKWYDIYTLDYRYRQFFLFLILKLVVVLFVVKTTYGWWWFTWGINFVVENRLVWFFVQNFHRFFSLCVYVVNRIKQNKTKKRLV